MTKLIMCRGIPGSGKSYWAERMAYENSGHYIVVTRDDIREQLGCAGDGWSKDKEFFVVAEMRNRIINGLKRGKTVISADTNLTPKHEASMRNIADTYGADFEIREFHTSLDICIERDSKREGYKKVGEKKIREYYETWLKHYWPKVENDNLQD